MRAVELRRTLQTIQSLSKASCISITVLFALKKRKPLTSCATKTSGSRVLWLLLLLLLLTKKTACWLLGLLLLVLLVLLTEAAETRRAEHGAGISTSS